MLPEGFAARMRALLGSEYGDFLASFDRPLCTGLRKKSAESRLYGRSVPLFARSRAMVPDGVLL